MAVVKFYSEFMNGGGGEVERVKTESNEGGSREDGDGLNAVFFSDSFFFSFYYFRQNYGIGLRSIQFKLKRR